MEIRNKKTAIVLIGILAFSLLVGNALFAGDTRESHVGLVSANDVTFISSGFSESAASSQPMHSDSVVGLVAAGDLEFLSGPFNGALVSSGPAVDPSPRNVVSSTDLSFISNGVMGSDVNNLVCMVDGVQVTGRQCLN